MRKMECKGCGCVVRFEVDATNAREHPQSEDEDWYYFCPVCSSVEPSREE